MHQGASPQTVDVLAVLADGPRMTESTVAAVRRFSRFYTRQLGILGEGLLSSPYTLTEVRVLYEIAHGEEVSASDLINQLRLDPGYLSRILQRFDELGLVRKRQSNEDRRRSILTLTAKGMREFAPLDDRQNRAVEELIVGKSHGDERRLVEAMRVIEEVLGDVTPVRSNPRLRQSRAGDLSWVGYRFSQLFHEEYGYDGRFEQLVVGIVDDYLNTAADSKKRCWIAGSEGEVVGSGLIMPNSRSVAQLRLLYVEPRARRAGVGRRLVQECVNFARRSGFAKISLWTQNEEIAARSLYASCGFTLTAEEPHRRFTKRQIIGETWELKL